MPKLGYDMTEGKLLRWLKYEGDSVKAGEAIFEIETDKVTLEVEASDSGILQHILGTRICCSILESNTSTSRVTLSVSISKMASPSLTKSTSYSNDVSNFASSMS